jgi:hypothetical protein
MKEKPIATISRSEREDLQRLIRQREKVLKSAAKQRSAELLADFENQMGSEYAFDNDEVWKQATLAANREVKKAQGKVEERCRELKIPQRFAPSLSLDWHARGWDNSIDKRRAELRNMAKTRIAAIERGAITEIELSCLQAQEQIAVTGLSSEAAKRLFKELPAIDQLMPLLSYNEIAGESEPPIAEQLVSPNALRQRKWRERQRLLRNDQQALRDGE